MESSNFTCKQVASSTQSKEYEVMEKRFTNLRSAQVLENTAVHNFDISGMEYRTSKFVIGIDTEKITEAGWTGLNTRAGDLLTVNFKLLDTNGADERKPDRMHVVLHADLIMQVHQFGISVLN